MRLETLQLSRNQATKLNTCGVSQTSYAIHNGCNQLAHAIVYLGDVLLYNKEQKNDNKEL